MKQILIVLVLLASAFSVSAQRFQAIVGNGYGEIPGKGDLSYRFGEIRWLPFIEDGRETKFGFFLNGTQVSSKFSGFIFQGQEITPGLSLEYCPTSSYITDVYSWFNIGYKLSEDEGISNNYRSQQKDEMIFFFAGIMFRDKLERAFYVKKFTLTYQNPVHTEGNSQWNSTELTGGFWNKEYFALGAETSIASVILNPAGSLKFDPTVFLIYSYEAGSETNYYHYGLRAIFRRDLANQELLTLGGGFKTAKGKQPMLMLEAMLSLSETIRFFQ